MFPLGFLSLGTTQGGEKCLEKGSLPGIGQNPLGDSTFFCLLVSFDLSCAAEEVCLAMGSPTRDPP